MKTLLISHQKSPSVSIMANPVTDLSRGTQRFGIRGSQVTVETSVLEDYSELDSSLGLNAAGTILTVLAQHVALTPGGGRDDRIVVMLRRRDDGRMVELELALVRHRREGHACLHLIPTGDHPLDEQ